MWRWYIAIGYIVYSLPFFFLLVVCFEECFVIRPSRRWLVSIYILVRFSFPFVNARLIEEKLIFYQICVVVYYTHIEINNN